jgi:DNA-binding IclR family transcriptional regulator
MVKRPRQPETAQTLDRGLRLLSLLTAEPQTVTDLAKTLRINRTVAYRLVATLEQHGLAQRMVNGRITAGVAQHGH